MDHRDITTPITQTLLRENDNLALIFPVDVAKNPRFELYFFRVARRQPLHRVYNSELPVLAPGEKKDFTWLGAEGLGVGNDILEVWEERPFRIHHFSFGILPHSDLWLYKSIPADVPQAAWALKVEPPKIGDKREYIEGKLSPYDNPTVAGETVLFHKLSVNIGLYNASGRPIRPSLRLLGAGYDTIPVKSRNVIDKMVKGVVPCRFLTVGGLRHFTYIVPDVWEPYAVTVDAEVIEKLLST